MSLLNDMLRDLVQQQKVITTPMVYSNDILQETKLLKRSIYKWLSSVVIFIVVFLSVVLFKYYFYAHQFSRSLPLPVSSHNISTQEELPESRSTNTNKLEPVVAKQDISETEDVEKTASTNTADTKSDNLQDIADLLLQANRALAQDKLTTPFEDNAYSYFQKIALLSPNHPQVKIGFELIAARYLQKAREQLSLGNYQQAEISRQRANFVAPDYFIDHDFSSAEKSMMQTALGADEKLPEQHAPALIASTKPQSETIKPFIVAEAASLHVVPNASWKDQQLAIQANDLVRQNKTAEAIQLLKNFVATESKPVRSMVLLGDLYFQQGNAEALDILLKNSAFLSVVDRAKLKAQLLAVNGDMLTAISELEKQLTAAENNEPYRAFLANLYHKTGQYQQSVVSYQRLLNSYGEKPAYWLGVALAFDGLMQNKNALQAYQHLREFPQLQEQVRNYINQRIAVLSNE